MKSMKIKLLLYCKRVSIIFWFFIKIKFPEYDPSFVVLFAQNTAGRGKYLA